jgi:DNA-directed RNA polymerase specialized sigma subunit
MTTQEVQMVDLTRACSAYEALHRQALEKLQERDTLIVALLRAGHTTDEVAAACGLSQPRIVQIRNAFRQQETVIRAVLEHGGEV